MNHDNLNNHFQGLKDLLTETMLELKVKTLVSCLRLIGSVVSQLSNPFTALSTQKPDCSVTCCHASSAWATTACSWWRLQNMRITDASVTMWPSCRQLEESKTDSSHKKAHKKEGFPPWLWDSLLWLGEIHFYLLQNGFVNLWNLVDQVMEGNFWWNFDDPLPEGRREGATGWWKTPPLAWC